MKQINLNLIVDEVPWILKNLIRQDRSRISVVKKMKQIGINPIKVRLCLNTFDL